MVQWGVPINRHLSCLDLSSLAIHSYLTYYLDNLEGPCVVALLLGLRYSEPFSILAVHSPVLPTLEFIFYAHINAESGY